MNARYVSTGKAAQEAGVTPVTLLRWMHAGLIAPERRTAGGHFRWDLDKVRRFAGGIGEAGDPTEPSGKPEPTPVVAAIVTHRGRVLIGRRQDNEPPWGFPAGQIQPGESPADAAVREVKEETGLEIIAGDVLGRRLHPMTGRHMIYMAAWPVRDTDVFVGDTIELAEVKWATLTTADRLLPGMFGRVRDYLIATIGSG